VDGCMFSPPFWGDIGRRNAYPKKRKFPRTEIPENNLLLH